MSEDDQDPLTLRLIAGGDHAIRFAVEGAEDSLTQPIHDLQNLDPPLSSLDSLIGLAASGRTPYVLGAMKYARSIGCYTAGVCCTLNGEMRDFGDDVVECPVGGEVVTGSTRLKSGTAQKMVSHVVLGMTHRRSST